MKSLNELLTKILYQSDREPVPTGFKDLDRILDGGLKPFTTTLVAGRPGMGKTAFLLDVAMHHALTTGKTVVYFSAFESAEDIAMRVIGKHTMAHGLEKILRLKGSETKDILDAAYDAMKRIPIAVCDESKIAESEIKDICSAVDNLGMIIVDLDIRFEEDTHEKDQFIHKMTQLSTAVNAPVLCSCVVNRSVERRENKRPDLDSLGLAGILGNQQPDIIALYREDYYDYHLSAESGESAAEAIVIPFGTDNVEQYRTARIKWNYPRRRFENDVMIESSICSQSLNNVDNSHSHR